MHKSSAYLPRRLGAGSAWTVRPSAPEGPQARGGFSRHTGGVGAAPVLWTSGTPHERAELDERPAPARGFIVDEAEFEAAEAVSRPARERRALAAPD